MLEKFIYYLSIRKNMIRGKYILSELLKCVISIEHSSSLMEKETEKRIAKNFIKMLKEELEIE